MDAGSAPTSCARHPDVVADGTCGRCGDFVCRGCRHHGHPELCGACGDRLPRGIAWEDRRYGLLPWRFVLTFFDVLVRPRVAFPGPARVGPAVAFALCGWLASVLPFAGIILYVTRPELTADALGAALIGSLVVVAVATGVLISTQAVCFGAGLLMVGRRHGVLRFGGRAACYASAIWWVGFFIGAAASLAFDMSDLGWIAILTIWALLTGRVFIHAARGLGLATQPAVIASVGPTIACAIPVALLAYEQLSYLATGST